MKLIIAHLANGAVDPVATALRDLGVSTTTVSEVYTWVPQKAQTLRYRGATMQTRLRSSLRLECLSTDDQTPAVVAVLRGHMGGVGVIPQVVVIDLEELYETPAEDYVLPDDFHLV